MYNVGQNSFFMYKNKIFEKDEYLYYVKTIKNRYRQISVIHFLFKFFLSYLIKITMILSLKNSIG